jgi:acetyl-CoA acetyltransferase family protein
MKFRNAVVVDGMRSPFARAGKGKFEATRMDEVGAKVVRALLDRNPKVKDTMIEDFGIGMGGGAPEASSPNNVCRLAGLPHEIPNFSSNRACASSMETAQRIAMGIMLGEYDCGIAFGVERMGPLGGGATDAKKSRITGAHPNLMNRNEVQRNMAYDHFKYFSTPIPDFILDSPANASMVQTAQNVIEMYNLSREEMDAFSMRSHQKLAAAYQAGFYKNEVLPLEIEQPIFDEKGVWLEKEKGPMVTFDVDECLRPNTNMETLAKLKPVAGIVSYGNRPLDVTAGNSCGRNVGATAVLLMSEEMAIKLGLEPLARIIGLGNGGVKQQIMGMGPVVSTKKALKHAGLEADQIDRVEFNEAFACQVITSLKEIGIPEDKVNVNGGSLGIGHPIGATGARLIMTICKELRNSNKRYGLCTQCVGTGQGATTIFERMD